MREISENYRNCGGIPDRTLENICDGIPKEFLEGISNGIPERIHGRILDSGHPGKHQ